MRLAGHRPRRGRLPFLLAGLIAGCSPESPKSDSADSTPAPGFVLLSVDSGQRAAPGPIRGGLRCDDEAMPPSRPCLAEDLTLAEAVLACGPVEATIDRGAGHRLLVRFPAGLSRRFAGMPADVEIVRCVQSRVGFSFSAGIATDPEAVEGNPAPFEALHSRLPREKQPE
jgi:hypothetical protein